MKRNLVPRKKFSVNRGSRENAMEKQSKKRKSTAVIWRFFPIERFWKKRKK